MLTHDEKRKSQRIQVKNSLSYKLVDTVKEYEGLCTSISGAGMSFIAEHSINPGKGLEVHLILEKMVSPPMTAFVEVVRCTELDQKEYEIAARIQSLTSHA